MANDKHPRFIRLSEQAHADVTTAADERGLSAADLASRLIIAGVAKLPSPDAMIGE